MEIPLDSLDAGELVFEVDDQDVIELGSDEAGRVDPLGFERAATPRSIELDEGVATQRTRLEHSLSHDGDVLASVPDPAPGEPRRGAPDPSLTLPVDALDLDDSDEEPATVDLVAGDLAADGLTVEDVTGEDPTGETPSPPVLPAAKAETLSLVGDAGGEERRVRGREAAPSPLRTDGEARYTVGAELGRGGMGVVVEAHDANLERTVALKLLIEQDDASLRARFMDEARVTGQLQHPSVPAVYELGAFSDGRLFFAMRRIEGRTLRDVIEDLRDPELAEHAGQYGRVRLLTVFSRVCRAIAYAHSRGVIHRDLKPDNIMLGSFGEVTVMDWGLAKVVDGTKANAVVTPDRERAPGVARYQTQVGEVTGTPHYMPPEQARGEIGELGPHGDIYALGAVLYELLTLEPPYDGPTVDAIRAAVVAGQLVPPSERSAERAVPRTIEALCLRCMHLDPAQRPKSAAWVADQVDTFLEGEQDRARKAAERDQLVEIGRSAEAEYYEAAKRHRQLQLQASRQRDRLEPWLPQKARQKLWAIVDACSSARLQAARHLSAALAAYLGALGIDGGHVGTQRALRGLYYSAFEAAEREGDRFAMTQYENLVRAFDVDRSYEARLKGDGWLEIETMPRGVRAVLASYRSQARVLQPTKERDLGGLPTRLEPLPMGSYLLRLSAPGLTETHVPVFVSRQEGRRLRIRLFPDELVGAGFVHVVGGSARLGGDPLAQLARPAHVVEVGDFFAARRPVRSGAYLEFLNALASEQTLAVAVARAPRVTPAGPSLWPVDGSRRIAIPKIDPRGDAWDPAWPVVSISCEDAEAYCQWRTRKTGQIHRLPTEQEWEKAARGVDGRHFPWGDAWEPSFCHMGLSRPGAPQRAGSGEVPPDTSPYGLVDMAGGVTEWTSSWLDKPGGRRVVKGGNWASGPTECRAASRFAHTVGVVLPTVGFRIVRDSPK